MRLSMLSPAIRAQDGAASSMPARWQTYSGTSSPRREWYRTVIRLPQRPQMASALEQGGAFSGRALAAVLASGLGALGQASQVVLVAVPADVAGVGVRDQHDPGLSWLESGPRAAVGAATLAAAPIDERAGVAGVVQHLQDPVMAKRQPRQGAFVGAGLDPGGEGEPFGGKRFDRGPGRAGALEGGEQVGDGVAHALVGVEHDPPGAVIDEADRQGQPQLAASGPW